MKPPVCKFCKVSEWGHVCGRTATNRATNTIVVATNSVANDATNKKTKNRRARGAYNAYQRVYMAVSRAVKGGRADWWPRRGNSLES